MPRPRERRIKRSYHWTSRLAAKIEKGRTSSEPEEGKEASRVQFIKDPCRFTKALLREARSGTLTSSKEEIEEFLRAVHHDEHRD